MDYCSKKAWIPISHSEEFGQYSKVVLLGLWPDFLACLSFSVLKNWTLSVRAPAPFL